MSRWLSNNPEDYTIGRLAVVPCATACTGLRWGPYEPFKRAGCVAGRGGWRYGYFVTVHGSLLCCRRLRWELQNGPLPAGYKVVPIDGNVCNNKIENLTLRQKEIV